MVPVEERVKAGAAFLDQKRPYWYNELGNQYIDMQDSACCVLGRLYGRWIRGLGALHMSIPESVDYGFEVDCDEDSYRELEQLWAQEIQTRRQSVRAE